LKYDDYSYTNADFGAIGLRAAYIFWWGLVLTANEQEDYYKWVNLIIFLKNILIILQPN
jgi:hypothetical protein